MPEIPFQTIDWTQILKTEQTGETGTAYSQTQEIGNLCIRKVTYSENYTADHWCQKGHIVHCLKGEFTIEVADREKSLLTTGMTFIVSDNASSHRATTTKGAELLIIDGDFLK